MVGPAITVIHHLGSVVHGVLLLGQTVPSIGTGHVGRKISSDKHVE